MRGASERRISPGLMGRVATRARPRSGSSASFTSGSTEVEDMGWVVVSPLPADSAAPRPPMESLVERGRSMGFKPVNVDLHM